MATILLVAISAVLAALLYILVSGVVNSPGTAPIGTSLAVGTAAEGVAGANYWYNFTIEHASGGITWNNIELQVRSPGGLVSLPASTSWTVYSLGGPTICTAAGPVASGWAAGALGAGTSPVASSQTLSVETTTALIAQGDYLYAYGVGSYSGSVQAKIP